MSIALSKGLLLYLAACLLLNGVTADIVIDTSTAGQSALGAAGAAEINLTLINTTTTYPQLADWYSGTNATYVWGNSTSNDAPGCDLNVTIQRNYTAVCLGLYYLKIRANSTVYGTFGVPITTIPGNVFNYNSTTVGTVNYTAGTCGAQIPLNVSAIKDQDCSASDPAWLEYVVYFSGQDCRDCANILPNSFYNSLTCQCECLSHWNGSNCDQCVSGYGIVSGTSPVQCALCNTNCTSCTTITDCTACNGANRDPTRMCYCNDGYANDTTGICVRCDNPNCVCPNGTATCTLCLDPNMDNSTGCTQCLQGYGFNSTGGCDLCNSSCLTCSNTTNCTSCYNSAFTPDANGLCNTTCSDTNADSSTNCTTCKASFGFNASNICVACPANCSTCTNSLNCTTCTDPNMNPLFSCSSCKCGYFMQGSTCTPCTSSCASCNSNGTICLTCSVTGQDPNGFCKNCTNGNTQLANGTCP